jgi:hypothetical protein
VTGESKGVRPKSVQWCDAHWEAFRWLVFAGTHSAIAGTMGLVQAWMDKARAEGRLPKPHQMKKLNALLARDAPLCCTLGPEVLQRAIDGARVRLPGKPLS